MADESGSEQTQCSEFSAYFFAFIGTAVYGCALLIALVVFLIVKRKDFSKILGSKKEAPKDKTLKTTSVDSNNTKSVDGSKNKSDKK